MADAIWIFLQDFNVYQHKFEGDDLVQYMAQHTEIPVIFVTLYLGLVFYGQDRMKDQPALKLKNLFTFWNFLLSAFSIAGCYYTLPKLVNAVNEKGLYFTVCSEPRTWYYNGTSGFWVALFILSKIPELVDTVFLVIQKKPVIFLHWYHHTTVMLYCWHAYVHTIGPGMWFATMNYVVHSIMYSYYFLMNLSSITRQLVKPIAPIITTLQLLQMIVGMAVTVGAAYWMSNHPNGCYNDPANSRMGLMMYTSYFVLFAALFKKLYLSGGRKSRKDDSVCSSATEAMNEMRSGSPNKAKRA
jgi:elongation of very long chain fatty acids protein 6